MGLHSNPSTWQTLLNFELSSMYKLKIKVIQNQFPFLFAWTCKVRGAAFFLVKMTAKITEPISNNIPTSLSTYFKKLYDRK